MTTHRQAWLRRAGVVVALVTGALLALPATAVQAAEPRVQITGLSSGTIDSGQRAELRFRVTNANSDGSESATIRVSSSFGELSCEGQCDFTDSIEPGSSKEYTATLVGGNVPPGERRNGQVRLQATIDGETGSTERDVTVRGPQRQEAQTVREVSGRVTDAETGRAVSNATVAINDSQDHRYTTSSNDDGYFRFVGSPSAPITPGEIYLGASKDDVIATKTINGNAGQTLSNQRIALRLTKPSPSASPSVTATAAVPTPTVAVPTLEAASSQPVVPAPAQAASEDSGGGMEWLLIILGGLLVALGVGAIVLLAMRRKDAEGEADEDENLAAAPPPRGGFAMDDATRIATPPGPDPTMVGRPGLGDAPTMMHSPVADEFPDPYGAPPPGAGGPRGPQQPPYGAGPVGWNDDDPADATRVGYGAASGGYAPTGRAGAPASGTYGTAPGHGGPSGGGEYGSETAIYGGAASEPGYRAGGAYGAPTSGAPGGTYGAPTSGAPGGTYGAPTSGAPGGTYGAPTSGAPGGTYGAPTSGAPGYRGYGAPSSGAGGYGGPPAVPPAEPGYRDSGAPTGRYGNRYEEPGGGYDEPTGRYDRDATSYGPPNDPYGDGTYAPGARSGHAYGAESVPSRDEPPRGYPTEPTRGYEPEAPRGYQPETPRGYQPEAPRGYQPETPRGYEPEAPRGYEPEAPRGYEPAPEGYPGRGGAYREPEPGDRYGQSGNGYGEPDRDPRYGRGYGGSEPTGGYGPSPEYGRPPEPREQGYGARGYEQDGGYYDRPEQGGGRRHHADDPEHPQSRPGRQQPLDWLD